MNFLNNVPDYTIDWTKVGQYQLPQIPQYGMAMFQSPQQNFGVDMQGRPVQGGTVTIANQNSNYQAPTFTDKLGMFAADPIGWTQGRINGYQGGDGLLRDVKGNVLTNPVTGAAQIDPNHISRGDVWSGIGAGIQTGLGAYGMFQDIGYKKDLIQNQRNELNFAKEQFAEKQRHRQAVVNMNKGIA